MRPSLESLILFKMYLERRKADYKTDIKKTPTENLAEYVCISLSIEGVEKAIEEVKHEQNCD